MIYQDRHARGRLASSIINYLLVQLIPAVGVDYKAVPVSFSLSDSNPSYCFTVPILEDNLHEIREDFDSGVIIDPKTIIVAIRDNEGKAVIMILYQENSHRNFTRLGEN